MKLAIVGTRNPGVSYQEWEHLLISKINVSNVSLVVSGGAKGIDTYAKLFCGAPSYPLNGISSKLFYVREACHSSSQYANCS